MPIPATTAHDLFLCSLLQRQVDDFERPVDLADVVNLMGHVDRHACEANSSVPNSVYKSIRFLERHMLLEFWPDNPHVRLTPLGVYTALLFKAERSEPTGPQ
jgi:hypothetical protein